MPELPALAAAGGVFFVTLTRDRLCIASTIERLIDMLDAMDGDENLEVDNADYEDGSDDEPMLGAREYHPVSFEAAFGGLALPRTGFLRHDRSGSQEHWSVGATTAAFDDCEDVSEDEGAITGDDEYSLGWEAEGNQVHLNMSDWEADLATTEEIDQVRRLELSDGWMVQDSEPDLGWAESAGKGIVGPQNCLDDRENDDEREEDGDRIDFDGGEDDHPGFIWGGNEAAEARP
jgi:hypothetical protein